MGDGGPSIAVTMSVGLALADNSAMETAEAVIARADRALYTAKSLGRDRVMLADGVNAA
jgi:GGDEF domain-containing protein